MADFAKSNVPRFTIEVFQNEHLPREAREVNAIVTVASTGGGTSGGRPLPAAGGGGATGGVTGGLADAVPGDAPHAAVVIMVDCSGSMGYPPAKLAGARRATEAAIATVRDGVAFGVVAGTHKAVEVYPGDGRLAVASEATRAEAREALSGLTASGGTAIGTWLRLAQRLLGASAAEIRHGILLTDGRNEHEEPEQLTAALDACASTFTCDARGVGTDWEVKEVTSIATALLGTADIVAEPHGLTADFTAMMESAMGKGVGDVSLRLWTPVGAEVLFVKQVAPAVTDLTGRRSESPPRSADYPTGSWGDESRDYHVCLRVPAADVGHEMLAARVALVIRDPADPAGPPATTLGQGLIRAVWTDDLAASTRINPQVAHYTGQAELADAIQQGLRLRRAGDVPGATARLGRAVQLAHASGNADTARLLAKVVDVEDAAEGTVRLKAQVTDIDEMTLETRSTKTVRVKK